MDADRLDLVRHLFALATEIAEDAHDVAVDGQNGSAAGAAELRRAAERLQAEAGNLGDLARAIAVITDRERNGGG
ncbi:hypothetical protein [Minwuia thermotolerans]|jgi:hypothetical protein|uniref:hypothetical protein n=1 Tax=Minwuia thermotolerans TaxID=2056226 RepID=UPI0007F14C7F|nr:hypothetical protein [Minwuia thermotolerans]ANK82611.1 MAG: hypothetical protein TEF_18775 [Rhizobiales bacterium NRL2]